MFTHFKNNQFARYLYAFAQLFSNVVLTREDSTGVEVQRFVVPIEYGPKERWYTRLVQDPQLLQGVSQILPRMCFECTNVAFDASRKLVTMNKLHAPGSRPTVQQSMYVPVPYTLGFELNILTKLQQDGLQIVEQILPFFTPDMVMMLSVIPELGIEDEVPLSLVGVTHSDNYEGDFEKRRSITWTLSFNMKVNFYGPHRAQSRIQEVLIGIHNTALSELLDPPENFITESGQNMLETEAGVSLVTEHTPDEYTDADPDALITAVPDPVDQDPDVRPVTANTTITENF